MTNKLLLKAAIVSKGLTQKDIAKMLGISENSVSRKVNNMFEFRASEIQTLCEKLEITSEQRERIFFDN